MPSVDSLTPSEWVSKAEEDLAAAKVLLGSVPVLRNAAVFHIQQALEKYLKAFLLAKGWKLQRVHDLVRLLGDAVAYEPSFARFDSTCVRLTEFYFESRYPLFPPTVVTDAEVRRILTEVEALIAEIKPRI
jgi:HEPN domain-containing protein